MLSRIYDNLPEVRKRREEERRRAQYDSYRLKAQLYNKVGLSRATGTCWSLKPQTLFTSSRESPATSWAEELHGSDQNTPFTRFCLFLRLFQVVFRHYVGAPF